MQSVFFSLSVTSVLSIFTDESFALNASSTSSLTDGIANSSFLSTAEADSVLILPHNEEVFDWLNKFEVCMSKFNFIT